MPRRVYEDLVADTDDPSLHTAAVMAALVREPAGRLPPDDYVIGEEIGRGGMGAIFRAEQAALRRTVAVKRLHEDRETLRGPFLAEAQVLGLLEHPGIVPVHALRSGDDGVPMLAMKLVEGASWDQLLHGDGRDAHHLDDHLRILLSVCNAVAFAHSRGILHRDIKPANVMVGSFGEVYLMDWGIAVAMDERLCEGTCIVHRDVADTPAGTPGYMAPELARGIGEDQDERTDVYLLGASLHEVVTRRKRHRGDTARDILIAAAESAPFSYAADVPEELAAICARATAADKAARYQSVAALARAVEDYLEQRDARRLIDEAEARIAELRIALAAGDDGEPARARLIHQKHAEARFALDYATRVHPEAAGAASASRDLGELMIAHALATEDLALAERVLLQHDDADAQRRVEALRHSLAQREREIDHLRAAAEKRDWSTFAAPISTLFLTTALLGAIAAALTRVAFEDPDAMAIPIFAVWGAVALISGLAALRLLRARSVPDNLVSPRMIGLWAAVALACIVTGTVSQMVGERPFSNAGYQSAMIAIGFTAMALQTRRWLLVPATLFVAGAAIMRPGGEYNVDVFGVIWLLAMGGVGIALRFGARLDEPDA